MPSEANPRMITLHTVAAQEQRQPHAIALPDYGRERYEDVAFMTAMTLVLMGNYSQTGHFGGPLAYTPYNVAVHLGGPELGGLRYDLRQPKHPYRGQVHAGRRPLHPHLLRPVDHPVRGPAPASTRPPGEDRFAFDPEVAMLAIDALGFRRSPGAVEHAAGRQRPGGPPAVRPGQAAGHPRPHGPRRDAPT